MIYDPETPVASHRLTTGQVLFLLSTKERPHGVWAIELKPIQINKVDISQPRHSSTVDPDNPVSIQPSDENKKTPVPTSSPS